MKSNSREGKASLERGGSVLHVLALALEQQIGHGNGVGFWLYLFRFAANLDIAQDRRP